jgi:hypothetical protein
MTYQSKYVHPVKQSSSSKYQSVITLVASRIQLVQEVKFLICMTEGPVILFLPGHQLSSLTVCISFLSIYTQILRYVEAAGASYQILCSSIFPIIN